MRWPEATLYSVVWISLAFMVFSMSKCVSDADKAHAQIMTSPGTHVE